MEDANGTNQDQMNETEHPGCLISTAAGMATRTINETEPKLHDTSRNDDNITEMKPAATNKDDAGEENAEANSSEVNWSTYWPLCKMIKKNDWKGVEDFVGDHPEALTVRITDSSTIFHHIVNNVCDDVEGAACLIEKLASKVDPKTLSEKYADDGWTVLTLSAMLGNLKASEILVKYNSELPNIESEESLPIHDAAAFGHKDTVQYLTQVTAVDKLNGKSGANLLSNLIQSNLYDVALDLLKLNPAIGRDGMPSRAIVLQTLARKPLAFDSGNRLGRLQSFIYKCIAVTEQNISSIGNTKKNQSAAGDLENLVVRPTNYSKKSTAFGFLQQITATFGAMCQELHVKFWNALVLLVPCIKILHEQKLTHMQTVEILRTICEGLNWNDPDIRELKESLHTAAGFGISEVVNEYIMASNDALYWATEEGLRLFHIAVLHRQEKVYNLIHGLRYLNDMIAMTDDSDNNMLHFAGRLVPSSKVAGAALQMQRELQWFKAVGNLVRPSLHEEENKEKKTPREVFTEAHQDLVKEGEKWMKDTASSCTVAVTLIITVVFAAAFTVPGGNSDGGIPIFLNEKSFLIFAISDALALFSSTTSLLMFLGILTSRYSEEDFLVSLPRKLIIGLITLFISIASMTVTFGATMYLVLSHSWKWVIFPISLFGCVPVTLFALLQFPLLLEMILSTYGPSNLCGL